MKIGVLALQGGVEEHIHHIKILGHEAVNVKKSSDLDEIKGLILPGGESTAISKIMRKTKLIDDIKGKIKEGMPVWGTCAGMILLAKKIENATTAHLQVMDIEVKRNAYGRQLDSFCVNEVIDGICEKPIPLVFIRAPYINKVGKEVKVIHKVKGNIVAARQGNIIVTSFHPELTENLEFHKYFLKLCV